MSSTDYIRIPAAGDPMQPSRVARLSWIVILTLAAIGGSLALSCVAPFAALAVALGGTAGVRASLRAVAIVWLANQVVGFVFFHFPITTNTFLWGVAIGIAALVTTTVAFVVIGFCGRGSSVRARARRDVSGAAGGGVGAGVGCGGGAGGFCEYKLTVTTTVRTANMTASLS